MNLIKLSQNKAKLEELWNVNPKFSQQIEHDISSLPKSPKSIILKFLKENPIQSEQDFQSYQSLLNKQTSLQSTLPSQSIPQPLLNKINQTTQSQDYRKWLISISNLPSFEEDLPKIKQLLSSFDKIKPQLPNSQKNIHNLKDSSELYSLINQHSSKSNQSKPIEPTQGLTFLAQNLNIINNKIDLLELASQDALDQITNLSPNPPNWCVLRGTKYSPHRYFCVLINNSPEILIHPESQQIKDHTDKPLSSLIHTQIAVELLKQFPQLKQTNTNDNEYIDGDDPSDYSTLYRNYKQILKLQKAENENDQTEIQYFIQSNPQNLSLLQDENKTKYLHLIHPYDIDLDTFNHNDLILYANYLKINQPNSKDPSKPSNLDRLEGNIHDWLYTKENFTRYHNKIPDELKSTHISKIYKDAKERKIQEILSLIQRNSYLATWQDDLISNMLLSNSGNLSQKDEFIQHINKYMETYGQPPNYGHKYVENILKTNPPTSWTDKIIDNFDNSRHKIPYWAESWANSQLENPSSPYHLPLFNYAPQWNSTWAEDKLTNPNFNPPPQWIEMIMDENYIPLWAEKYMDSQMNSNNPHPQILDSIIKLSPNDIPDFAEDFFVTQLSKPNPHPSVIQHISQMLYLNGYPDPLSEDWIGQNLNSQHPNPILTKHILKYYKEEEIVPDIAQDWLDNYLSKNKINKTSNNWLHFLKN